MSVNKLYEQLGTPVNMDKSHIKPYAVEASTGKYQFVSIRSLLDCHMSGSQTLALKSVALFLDLLVSVAGPPRKTHEPSAP